MSFDEGEFHQVTSNSNILGNESSSTENAWERDENLAKVEIATLSLIFILAVLGNGSMLFALRKILQYRPMSRMYFFMMNLSIVDLCVAFGNILPQLAWDITFRFRGPDLLCRIVKFLQVFVLYLSTYVLTSMAIDRYLVVCHHSFSRNYYGALRGPKLLVFASYVIAFLLATPQAFLFSLKNVNNEEAPGMGVQDCWVTFIEPYGARAYVSFFVIFVFVLPLLIIGLSYGAICYKVMRFKLPNESKKRPEPKRKFSFSSTSDNRNRSEIESDAASVVEHVQLQKVPAERCALQHQISQAKIKTLKLTFVVVICFFICWAPFCITQLIMVYNTPKAVGPIHVIFLLLASLNSCTNPWIYLAFSESLCNQLRVFLGMGLKRGSDDESIGDEAKDPADGRKAPKRRDDINIKTPLNHNSAPLTSIRKHSGMEEQKPETKSDIL